MGIVAIVLVVLAVLAPVPALAADPVKVGYLGPQSGIFAPAGKDMLEGLKMALEQGGYQAAGRKIDLIEEDSEGNPATAQFWTYKAGEFLKTPAYDRNYPPVKP